MSLVPQAVTRPAPAGSGNTGNPTGEGEATGKRNVNDRRLDEISSLRKHFADDDLQSTEVRVLQEEGEHLSKVLKKAFPNDDRDTWTYADLEDAVQKSRRAWETKERIGHGKPQKLFHSLMRKFDAHSNLFQVIPSGNMYASLVTGATAILVKASVNHSKTIEELSDALDAITDAVAIGNIESNLIRSQAMQNAVAKLYIAIFLFLGDAATWYKSSSASKLVHSLHKNFAERFHQAIGTITQLAANVRHIAQLGSQAEVRVVRLGVEGIQDELRDVRVGMPGQFQMLAQYLQAQHGETMKQHEKILELLSSYKSAGMLPAPQRADDDFQRLIQSAEQLVLLDAPTKATARPEEATEGGTEESVVNTSEADRQTLREQLETFIGLPHHETDNKPTHHPNLFDRPLSQEVNKWLSKCTSSMLYLEYLYAVPSQDTILAVGARVIAACKSATYTVVSPEQQIVNNLENRFSDPEPRLAVLILLLMYRICELCPDNEKLNAIYRNYHKRLEEIRIVDAADMLSNTILECPLTQLYIIIPGYPVLAGVETDHLSVFLRALKRHMYHNGKSIKVLILSAFKLTNLVSLLEPHEIALLRQQQGKNKAPKTPIVVPERKSDG